MTDRQFFLTMLRTRHTPAVVDRIDRLNPEFVAGFKLRGLHRKASPRELYLFTGVWLTTKEFRSRRHSQWY